MTNVRFHLSIVFFQLLFAKLDCLGQVLLLVIPESLCHGFLTPCVVQVLFVKLLGQLCGGQGCVWIFRQRFEPLFHLGNRFFPQVTLDIENSGMGVSRIMIDLIVEPKVLNLDLLRASSCPGNMSSVENFGQLG